MRIILSREFLIVDGYNIIHSWEQLKSLADVSLESARQKLIDIMLNYQGYKKINIIIVFDGYLVKGNIGSKYKHGNVNIIFTKEAETADNYIEKTVNKMPKEYKVRVATSDALEQLIILGQGAQRMSARELKNEIDMTEKSIRKNYIENKPPKSNMLMDNLDKETAQMLEKMRRATGSVKDE